MAACSSLVRSCSTEAITVARSLSGKTGVRWGVHTIPKYRHLRQFLPFHAFLPVHRTIVEIREYMAMKVDHFRTFHGQELMARPAR